MVFIGGIFILKVGVFYMWGGIKGILRFWVGCVLLGDLDFGIDCLCKFFFSEFCLFLLWLCIFFKIFLFVIGSLLEFEEVDVGDCCLLWLDFDFIFLVFFSFLLVFFVFFFFWVLCFYVLCCWVRGWGWWEFVGWMSFLCWILFLLLGKFVVNVFVFFYKIYLFYIDLNILNCRIVVVFCCFGSLCNL